MREVSFFHRETGIFHGTILHATSDDLVAANTPPDHIAIEGFHDNLSKRVDVENVKLQKDGDGNEFAVYSVIEWIPPIPSQDHVWNPEAKRWQLSTAASEKIAKKNAALARIAELESSQHKLSRKLLLNVAGGALFRGSERQDAIERLIAIDLEIEQLERDI